MWRGAAVLLLAAACGRVGFDARGRGDGAVGEDGALDDGFIPPACRVGTETVVAGEASDAGYADALWTGTELALAWGALVGEYDIMFVTADARGAPLAAPTNISNAAEHSWFPALAWSGTEYAVTWSDDRDGDNDVRFARIDPATGQRIGADVAVTTAGGDGWFPTVVWTGARYETAWADDNVDNFEVWRAALTATGAVLAAPARATTSATASWAPVVAWTGAHLVTAWGEATGAVGQVQLRFVDAQGGDSGPIEATRSPGLAAMPAIAWTGDAVAMVWEDSRNTAVQVFAGRFDTTGAPLGPELQVSRGAGTAGEPDLAWNGTSFGVTWEDDRSGVSQIYFALLDASGARIGGEVPVTAAPTPSFAPAIAWTGSEFVIAYHGLRGARTDHDLFTVAVCVP